MKLLTKLLMKGGASPWIPNRLTGAAFSATQIASGLSGSYDTTSNANRIYWHAPTSTVAAGGTMWSGWIKGTGATISMPNSSNPGAVSVSVDGGAYTTAANAVATYTLFTGLSDTAHYVCIRIGAAYGGGNVYFDKLGGNILNITGASPYVDLPSVFAISANTNSIFTAAGAGIANTTNFTPALSKYNAAGAASNATSVIIRGNFQKLVVSLNGAGAFTTYVSVDGAAPTTYASIASTGLAYAMEIPATAGTHTYYIWTSERGLIVSAAGDATAIPVLNTPQIHQFGDSITFGIVERGNVDTFRIGAAIGYPALTLGVSGYTIANLDTNIDTWLASTPVTANDVAVLAIGRNDVGGSFSGAVTTSYISILNKLIAKGYGKILVRGILPDGNLSTTWPLENASIQSCITTVNNAKLIFVDTATCPAYTSEGGDNTHPNTAGYITIADYLLPKYQTALGI